MKLSRTQLIAWYTGEPEVLGTYIVKTTSGNYVALWDETYSQHSKPKWLTLNDRRILEEPVIEWTPLP